MDSITLAFRFVPDGEALPDTSGYRDPVVLRASWEAMAEPTPASLSPDARAPDASSRPQSQAPRALDAGTHS